MPVAGYILGYANGYNIRNKQSLSKGVRATAAPVSTAARSIHDPIFRFVGNIHRCPAKHGDRASGCFHWAMGRGAVAAQAPGGSGHVPIG